MGSLGSDGITSEFGLQFSSQFGLEFSAVRFGSVQFAWVRSEGSPGLVQFSSLGFQFAWVRSEGSPGLVQFSLLGFQFAWVRSEGSPGGVCHLSETSGAAICFRFPVSSLVFLPNPVFFLPCPFALSA